MRVELKETTFSFGDYRLDKVRSQAEYCIRRQYSGLAPDNRKGRVIVFVRAFVDDSSDSEDDGVFALGGLIADIDHWDTVFNRGWLGALHEPPRINYYKTNYALGAKKDFQGWDQDATFRKMARLASVIDPRYCEGITTHVVIGDHADVFKGGKIFPGEYGNPYYLCAFLLAERVAIHYEWHNQQPNVERVQKIDFVFDVKGNVGPSFENMFNFWLKPRYPLLGKCSHEDDREFPPSQMADMYAAWIRRSITPRVQMWTSADIYLQQIRKAAERKIDRQWLQDVKQYAIDGSPEMDAFLSLVEADFQLRRALRKNKRLRSRGSKLGPSG